MMKKLLLLLVMFLAIMGFCAEDLLILKPQIFYTGENEEKEYTKYSEPVEKEVITQNPDGTVNRTWKTERYNKVEKIKITLYKSKFIFLIYNQSEKTLSIQTKGFGSTLTGKNDGKTECRFIGKKPLPQDTFGLELEMPYSTFSDKDRGIESFPIITPESELNIVELRPKTGTVVSFDYDFKSLPTDGDKFIICYHIEDKNNFYNIWSGIIYSDAFIYKDNSKSGTNRQAK